ncbi:hypothetical protein Nepgr_031529 [Nepenthes gracilis]|uniref:Uncharacterized protein n=1 Tax=Nepenthes gracilis TaxID=150966 RepID=A0AAD3Y7L3_NEPGR|nr:hypothetical protein Nepgr_031529 [Nepenthes gracilis]
MPSYPDSNSASPIQDSTNMPSNLSPHQNFSCRNLKSDTTGSTTAHSPRMMIPNSEENPQFKDVNVKSPPAVPPSCRFWETSVFGGGPRQPMMGTPPLAPPSWAVASPINQGESSERQSEIQKPKSKALHWGKVRASSDRAMLWDQLKPASCRSET